MRNAPPRVKRPLFFKIFLTIVSTKKESFPGSAQKKEEDIA